ITNHCLSDQRTRKSSLKARAPECSNSSSCYGYCETSSEVSACFTLSARVSPFLAPRDSKKIMNITRKPMRWERNWPNQVSPCSPVGARVSWKPQTAARGKMAEYLLDVT